jgi:AAA domain
MNAHPFPLSVQQIVAKLGGQVTGRDTCNVPGPGHTAKDTSLSIKIDPTAPDGFLVYSHAGDDGITCKDWVREKLGLPSWTAARKSEKASKVNDEYIYRQADGTPYLKVCRMRDKRFFQQHWNGRTWDKGAPKGPKILYRLPELLKAEHDDVFIVEGEKDCNNLAMLGFTATTNSGGAGKWTSDLNGHLAGKNVYILPDNDEVGAEHARMVATNLLPVAREVRIVELPNLPPKGDVSDWLAAGGTVEGLVDLARQANPVKSEDFASNSEQPETANDGPKAPLFLTLDQWRERDLPTPDYLLDEIFSTTSRAILSAPTGLGKTNAVIALGMRMSSGASFLHWEGRRSAKVLYIDGEMSRRLLKQRLLAEETRLLKEVSEQLRDQFRPTGFHALSTEDIPNFLPLNTPLGQAAVEKIIAEMDGCDFLIFDNVMSLISGSMVDEDAWAQTLPWVKSLTRRGMGQLWVHHTGHDETKAYGTKTREWQMDVVIHLTKVGRPDTDVSFNLQFRKARERTPDNRAAFQDVNIFLVNDQWSGDAPSRTDRRTKVSPMAVKYLEALTNVVGSAPTARSKKLHGCHAVHNDDWKAECGVLGLLDPNGPKNILRAKFSKNRADLVAGNMVACEGEYSWIR